MPNYSTDLKTWGAKGSEYPDNYNYIEGEQPVDEWDNFIMDNVISDIEHLVDVTNNELIARDGSVSMTAALPLGGNSLTEIGGTTDAGAGAIRLASGSNISWRNNADSGDFGILTNASDDIIFDAGGEVQLNNTLNANSQTISDLPAPSNANDAVRKTYVDSNFASDTHASTHHEGGSDEIEASNLSGSSGTSGQVLQTDGSSLTWATISDTRTDISESGTTVVSDTEDINFIADGIGAVDDGDGTATVQYTTSEKRMRSNARTHGYGY